MTQMVKNLLAMWETRVQPQVRKIWRREGLPTAVFLPGDSHGQRILASSSALDCEESDMTDQLTHMYRGILESNCFKLNNREKSYVQGSKIEGNNRILTRNNTVVQVKISLKYWQ